MSADTPSSPSRFAFVPGADVPVHVVGGRGCWLHTADGRRILDAAGGAIVANIGHGRREVADAVHAALCELDYVVPLWSTPNRLALHERLVDRWLPPGFSQVFFTSGGSESTDSAVRLARAYHASLGRERRVKVVGRHPSYHGITITGISIASHSGRRAGYEPILHDHPKVPWDDAAAVVRVVEEEDPETIAAFIVEPVTGAAGACLMASDDYWRTVTDVCRQHDIVLIADEVMTGYGRCGTAWGHQLAPLEPDVIVGGKGLGGGYVPMGMVATTERIAAPLTALGGFMFFTFTGGDAMCAGADTVLRILEDEDLVARSARLGAVLGERLRLEFAEHPHVADVRGAGLFWGVELVRDRADRRPFPAAARMAYRTVVEALARDVWIYPAGSGPVPDAVMFGPPFVVTEDEIDRMVAVTRAALDAAVAAGAG
jgi:adenosylmethionine-8-amino-7-oxononanoate aminotransferase